MALNGRPTAVGYPPKPPSHGPTALDDEPTALDD